MNPEELSIEIQKIIERNKKVEQDKAWETSPFRRISIVIITYVFMCILFYYLESEKFYLDALVPTIGFALSNLSLDFLKKYWLKNKNGGN